MYKMTMRTAVSYKFLVGTGIYAVKNMEFTACMDSMETTKIKLFGYYKIMLE
jgi:hypothetical protein